MYCQRIFSFYAQMPRMKIDLQTISPIIKSYLLTVCTKIKRYVSLKSNFIITSFNIFVQQIVKYCNFNQNAESVVFVFFIYHKTKVIDS